MKAYNAPAGAYLTTNINAVQLVRRTLGPDVAVRFIPTRSGFTWCEIRLSTIQFTRSTVCCPGVNQMAAAVNAIKQAERLRRMVA